MDPRRYRAVLDATAHRGPDAEAARQRDGTWLGFRRLSVLDLSSRSHQPMVDRETDIALLFNGEIYNYLELRADLESHGHRFVSTGDTEVVLRGWIEWGDDLFRRCNGMWALAIDDPSRNGVVLCRDRFGEKPLHFGRCADDSWWFASEVAALLAAGVSERRLHLSRSLGFLLLGDVDDPTGSYVAGVSQVPAGAVVELSPRGPSAARQWFDLPSFVLESWGGAPEAPERIQEMLDRSVRLRLRSDVEVGSSLSGGVDSSTIVASMRAVDPNRALHTFTASFPGRGIDEWDRAAIVGKKFGITMHRVEPTADGFVADIHRLVHFQGAPIESPTVYAQWCVMKAASDAGVTVLLDGQGADETWGGYPKYLAAAVVEDLAGGHPMRAAETLRLWRGLGPTPRIDLRQPVGLLANEHTRARVRTLVESLARRRLGPAFAAVETGDPQGPAGSGPLLGRAAAADLGRVVLPRLLRYADRNSMAWSREVRLPFLDPAVVAAGLASGWGRGLRGGWTKYGLRVVAAARVPDEIVWRREKTAYEVPDEDWLRRADIQALLADSAGLLYACGLTASPSAKGLAPWRVLSLASLIDGYGLTP